MRLARALVEKVLFASDIRPPGRPNIEAAEPMPSAKSNVSLGFILALSNGLLETPLINDSNIPPSICSLLEV